MQFAFLNFQGMDLQSVLISVLVVTLSLSVHECSHAAAAYKLGDDTAKEEGRMTLNPLKHLDPIGVICFVFAKIGWAKPVPVNPLRLNKARSMKEGMMLVSLAGPASNLILSFISAFFFQMTRVILIRSNPAVGTAGVEIGNLFLMIFYSFFISNIFLAVFNLMPIPPLDGYKIFGSLLPKQTYFKIMQYERYIGIVFLVLIFFGGNFLTRIMLTLAYPFSVALMYPWEWLAGLILGV